MAVGSAPLPEFLQIEGIRIGVAKAGIKQMQRPDLTVFELCEGATIAGVFTQNAFCAAPVTLCKQNLGKAEPIRYLLINAGNANAGTGEQGLENAKATSRALAEKTGVDAAQILPFSTGVIGEHLPVGKMIQAMDSAVENLSDNNWPAGAQAIMTTDTRPKGASHSIEIAGKIVRISGICKGSGMIRPDMATMLSYVAIDAQVSSDLLQRLLRESIRVSFNRITVDGDTSTNDAAMLMASGKGELDADKLMENDLWLLQQALNLVMIELAQLIIRDGEGATKFVHVRVDGGRNEAECEQVAFAVAQSPLVKTALFASDANWGRILAAVGRAGLENLVVEDVSLFINQVLIAENGCRAASYTEEAGTEALAAEDIEIHIELNRGEAGVIVWTSDLSHEYISINAEYRS